MVQHKQPDVLHILVRLDKKKEEHIIKASILIELIVELLNNIIVVALYSILHKLRIS